jgi:hypothetical protein
LLPKHFLCSDTSDRSLVLSRAVASLCDKFHRPVNAAKYYNHSQHKKISTVESVFQDNLCYLSLHNFSVSQEIAGIVRNSQLQQQTQLLASSFVENLKAAVEKARMLVETVGNTWGKLGRKIRIAKMVIRHQSWVICKSK